MTNLLEHLKCPICFEIPDGKVYQCKNGHTFCSKCNARLNTCPQCRIILGKEKIRNRTLEQILDYTEFNCPNEEQGCQKILKRHEVSTHLKYCQFEPFYFCKLIGFQTCSYDASKALTCDDCSELLAHIREGHLIDETDLGKNSSFYLKYENIVSNSYNCKALEKNSVTIWTPHLVKYAGNQKKDATFLFLCQVSEVTKTASWICLSLNDYCASSSIVEYKISASSSNEGSDQDKNELLSPEITWKAPVMSLKDIEKDLNSFSVRISFCILNSFHNEKSKDLQLKVNIGSSEGSPITSEIQPGLPIKTSSVPELLRLVLKPNQQLLLQRRRTSCSYIPPSNSEIDNDDCSDDYDELIFNNVYCNDCERRPITKIRYKCLHCLDYDLCRFCMEKGTVHAHHVFARIQNKAQNDFFNRKQRLRALKGKSSYI